jgi:hypothetical protein
MHLHQVELDLGGRGEIVVRISDAPSALPSPLGGRSLCSGDLQEQDRL